MKIKSYNKTGTGRAFAGMILILVGVCVLLDNIGLYLPNWVISFPMFIFLLGLYILSRNNFKKPGAFVIVIIGAILLVDKMFPSVNFSHVIWPVVIISAGIYMILSKERKSQLRQSFRNSWSNKPSDLEWDKKQPYGPEPLPGSGADEPNTMGNTGEDFIDSVSVFGGIRKNIMSKNFRGGDIVNFFGGAEINLIQADITGTAVLDVTQVFGGTKIIVPPHWEIQSEMAAIFGGIEDKRPIHPKLEGTTKVLAIRGTSIFGGIDIRSY